MIRVVRCQDVDLWLVTERIDDKLHLAVLPFCLRIPSCLFYNFFILHQRTSYPVVAVFLIYIVVSDASMGHIWCPIFTSTAFGYGWLRDKIALRTRSCVTGSFFEHCVSFVAVDAQSADRKLPIPFHSHCVFTSTVAAKNNQ